MFLPPFLRLCGHRLAEGGPRDCPGLACTNQAHLQHGFSQAMHKLIVFVHGLLGHNLSRGQKTLLYPDCPYKAVHCRCKQKLPAQGMLGSVTSHRSVLLKASIVACKLFYIFYILYSLCSKSPHCPIQYVFCNLSFWHYRHIQHPNIPNCNLCHCVTVR